MSRPALLKFRLYVAGDAPNSAKAIANLAAFCKARRPGRSEVEIVDVCRDPKRALADAIILIPTLLVMTPQPVRRIVGALNDIRTILLALASPDIA